MFDDVVIVVDAVGRLLLLRIHGVYSKVCA
jgi:hypothetical protein